MESSQTTAYTELVEFLTSGPSREEIINFRPSKLTRQRVRYLMNAYRAGTLTDYESEELDEFYRVEQFFYQLKERARRNPPRD